jgi:HK97 family phage portal protein
MSAVVWKETISGHLCLWGNTYNRILHNYGGRVSEIRPLDPGCTTPERQGGQLRYRYESRAGGSESFAPEEILHIPGLGGDGLKGYSPIGLARQNLALPMAAEAYGGGFFGNGSNMAGIVAYDEMLSPEQLKKRVDSFRAQTVGLNKANSWYVTDAGAKFQRIGIPPDDAQFLETRRFGVLDVARLYRVPPHMLGDLEKSSYSSIEAQGLEFLTYTLMPWLVKFELEIKRKLLGIDSEFFVSFDARQLLRGDSEAQQKFFSNGRQQGYLSVNEIRQALRLPSIAGGDTYLEPQNMRPVGSEPSAPPAAGGAGEQQRALRMLEPVFTDAIARMYRTAVTARNRKLEGARAQEFQARHDGLFRMALEPAARSLCALTGKPFNERAAAAIEAFVELHDAPEDPQHIAEAAGVDAAALIKTLANLGDSDA